MAYTLWSQDIFSKGELSPYMYARATVNEYNNGLKTAQNVLTFPTGAAGKRFGTLYQSTLSGFTAYNQIYFETFQYLNECVYQLLFAPSTIYIYLEGILLTTVSMSLTASNVFEMSTTVLGNIFRCAGQGFVPMDLTRATGGPVAVSSFTSTTFTLASPGFTANTICPVNFTFSGGTIMQTVPQISSGVTYFVFALTTTKMVLFSNSQDAKAFLINQSDTSKAFIISSLGTGTTSIHALNDWTFAASTFKNLPFYDFNGAITSYDALTFTPGATTGASVTITVSGSGYSLLDSSYVGGVFIGNGGTSRITAVASATSFTVAVQDPFVDTSAIQGSLCILAEPAWSNTRGWPQVCSSYQNRALFANTASLPNGFFASVINDYSNFGDLTNDDDDAISWYPTSNNMNFIRFIVPYRSITVHTNTGIYSSPLSDISAITPSNFTLQLQDSTPADVLQPQAVDNQILVLSGNDAHQMLWDGINNAYTSNIVSVINEQTIRDPQDETAFADLKRAGSRFVFIINGNGTMAIFQTLIAQSVSGFTIALMEQSFGSAQFIQTASSSDGRCWFVVQRQVATQNGGLTISAYTPRTSTVPSTITLTGSNLSSTPLPATFTTGTLPTSSPQVVTTQYYWVIGLDANTVVVYLTQEDALAGINEVQFSNIGSSSVVTAWSAETIFTLEELTHVTYLDCAIQYEGSAVDTVTTGALFNAQHVKMVGDGFGFDAPAEGNIGNQVVFNAHGSSVDISSAYIGFPIKTIIEPMPLNIASGPYAKETTLTKPKRIMFTRFMFNNTIGGTINGVPIALNPFNQANIGDPPFPERGIFEMSIMKAWDDFNNPNFTIYHDDPFSIELLGLFYSVEI